MSESTVIKKPVKTVLAVLLAVLTVLPLASCAKHKTTASAKQRIGVVTGNILDGIAKEEYPDCKVVYFNNIADIPPALKAGRIDAYLDDEPVARKYCTMYDNQEISRRISDDNYAFIFKKGNELLCNQMDEYISDLKADGTLKKLQDLWFSDRTDEQTVNTEGLTGENGTLTFGVATGGGTPFAYVKDGKYVGYEVDIAYSFCRKYGYKLSFMDTNFSGMIAAVSSGKADMAASCISITEERKKSMLFSQPDYEGGIVMVTPKGKNLKAISSLGDLKGEKIAVQTGTVFDDVVSRWLPDSSKQYFNVVTDLAVALDSNKVKAYVADEPIARLMIKKYENHRILCQLEDDSYGFIFPKNTSKSKHMKKQLDEFILESRANGTLDEIDKIWFGDDEDKKKIDTSTLTAENGKLIMGISTTIGAPFCYVKSGKYCGYDLDVAVRFCKKYGYGIEFKDTDFSGLIAAVGSGKFDMAACCISITEERRQSVDFSEPDYIGGSVVVVNDAAPEEEKSFIQKIGQSFNRTFILESRWKLVVSGLETTLIIALLATVFGTVLAFALQFIYRRAGRAFTATADAVNGFFEKTPVVVILMILYYIIFGKSGLSGVWVAVIGFTVLFAGSVMRLLKMGEGAVGAGQREAALALGYTENEAYIRIILPQAARHFLPGYKAALVSMIKDTSIVGYIAVQDLTKVSDIIRSRTYEAFFPLIATAAVYFAVALLLVAVVSRIETAIDPKRRKKAKILKGADKK